MANYQNLKAAISAAIRTNGNQEITGQVLQDVLNSIVSVIGANYTFAGVATPATNPGTPDQNVMYLAMEGGTYTNFNGTVLPAGISLLMWNGSWTSETVMYGDGGVFDISVYKSSGGNLATYADLAAALDGGNNIPVGVRKGGMSVKFVCSSDNKYVQYRLMSDTFNTTSANWQGIDDEPTAGSDNLVKSGGLLGYIDTVENEINGKETFISSHADYTDFFNYAFHKGKTYRLKNLSPNTIYSFSLKNDASTTIGYTPSASNIPAGEEAVFTPYADATKIQARFSGSGKCCFSVCEDKTRIEVNAEDISSINDNIDSIEQKVFQLITFNAGGWSAWVDCKLYVGVDYILANNGPGTISAIGALNESGQEVTISGFSSVSPNETLTFTVPEEIHKVRFYASSLSNYTLQNTLKVSEEILDGKKETAQLQSNLEAISSDLYQKREYDSISGGWSSYFAYSFIKGVEYTLTNLGNGTITTIEAVSASGTPATITGWSEVAKGGSVTFVANVDCVKFRLYASALYSFIIQNTGYPILDNIINLENDVEISEGYETKDSIPSEANLIIVSKDGVDGHYSSLSDAYAAITDSAYTNQYEVIVYPGVYHELNLVPPAYTHTHGLAPDSVVITSEGVDSESDLPVFDQRGATSKLSNMTIISHNGYCIHYDYELKGKLIYNENLTLIRAVAGGSNPIIGGGSFRLGTKFVWKNCVFISKVGLGQVPCHTNANALNENTHIVFDSCVFVNARPMVGNVGGFGNCVCELVDCTFSIGERGLDNWRSPLRNITDPTLYRFNCNEWQIIGGGNKNLSMWQHLYGKTIGMFADYPITISGTAASVIFGYNPSYNNVKTTRLDCSLISEYYIADEQAGYPPYSEAKDVFQLWKRLGDCSVDNKTLTVTVNGVSKTYTFTEDYLTTKTAQATIIAAMQAVLDNVTIDAITQSGYGYDGVNTSDIVQIKVTSPDIMKGEFVTNDGQRATSTTEVDDIAGVACEDKPIGEYVKVWTSAFRFDTDYSDGEYGLDANGTLDANAMTKIGFVRGYNFYLY